MFYFKLLLVSCFFNVSYCCVNGCCKGKTVASQNPDKSKSKGNKSTGGGNPDNPTTGHTPTGHGPTGHVPSSYDDKKLSDIVMSNMYKKVESNSLIENHKDVIFFALNILNFNDKDSDKVWEDIKKLFDEEKLVLYEMKVASGFQYRFLGYKEDMEKIEYSLLFHGSSWQQEGVKELTNKIVAITIHCMNIVGSKTHQYIGDDALTASAVFPA